ncbi:TPA: DUF4261 domain-containing protein [Escherichia coli]|uniref:DUF4261 domain-containing protein n=1 Tax=Escherichia coli TaxID=562 RepID=UPI00184868A0|nr:DUF4261 domain-containing protein [Escherichia coli]EFH9072291.1 hypothetical protein [Escherichia coli]EHU9025558.1 DUF4261 domain-containing protein [Escherichia coli]MBC1086747.1 DUF4261 domain-containing protein [Escherichia coli]MBS8870273.1 DUF4261 domain-containing protein [Escherichia coli]
MLRNYHSTMKQATCELDPEADFFGLAGWGKHVISLVGFKAPYPQESIEQCVVPAHYSQEVKAQVRATGASIILYYTGYDTSPLEQYVALAAVAGALSNMGAVAVLHESAHTSLPAGVFKSQELGKHSLEMWREGFPLTLIFCGFVKYEVEDVEGVWMRTYGADCFGLPDFAAHAQGHHEGQKYSDIFNNVLRYLLESGAEMAAGHTMQVGETTFMKLRDPLEDEYYLQGPGTTLVVELIEEDECNAH